MNTADKHPNLPVAQQDPADHVTVERANGELVLGAWYWVKDVATWDDKKNGRKKGDEYEWFGCAVEIGSNYVQIESPGGGSTRVHLDDYWTDLRREADPDAVISGRLGHWQARTKALVTEIHSLTQRLGVTSSRAIAAGSAPAGSTGSSLMALSGQDNLKAYKGALVAAKDKTIPDLYKDLENANEQLTIWAKASMLPLKASITPMRETIATIDDRLLTFGLYAGISEQAVRCSEGHAADADEPLHVMQRRLYMDEEALLSYEAGGMDFRGIGQFDAWLCRPENRDRILPFPRTLVAMRVRRSRKERETHGDPISTFISIQEAEADKWTFLYVRNGEQVWRIACEIDFGEMIFPDGAIYREGEPMMVKMHGNSVEKLITVAEYEEHMAIFRESKAKAEAWKRANPGKDNWDNPHMRWSDSIGIPDFGSFRPSDWEPFDRSNVYFDEVMEEIQDKIKEYNRVAVIIQGLFDRSEILHPHPPVQTWRPDSFSRWVKLVYDASLALHDGEKPDFEAFRAELNATLGPGSVVVGQEYYWMTKEAEKENARRDRDYRTGATSYRYLAYRPYGNPGPGRVATIEEWKPRARTAVFRWERQAARYGHSAISQSIAVPAAEMLNISAYRPGDFKRFFADPRTRAEYLKWAPLLLTAEDWHAGKLREHEPTNQSKSSF
ncbi:hypothetical protein A8H39_01445 [Paraburkholderia fungorum]|uniref:hypothetical protein n=1 Tax=Paraburkholderia fungorum TaxID=134537 RepID=UPI0004852199|nr:hypothetical protein [Paraburkholderia fungorum]PNE59840.1 hypothetical protein A8H39_01445 [Paraburkholderia fungorum]